VRAVIARDDARRFHFVSVRSPYGRVMAGAFEIDPEAPETNAVVLDGRVWLKSDAALAVLSRLRGVAGTGLLRLVPKGLRDLGYDLIAQNRYRLFGRTRTCLVPAAGERDRFLDDTPPPTPSR
jgi:predicted DCC family thiol-disulfide oxidoreductase YuxK